MRDIGTRTIEAHSEQKTLLPLIFRQHEQSNGVMYILESIDNGDFQLTSWSASIPKAAFYFAETGYLAKMVTNPIWMRHQGQSCKIFGLTLSLALLLGNAQAIRRRNPWPCMSE